MAVFKLLLCGLLMLPLPALAEFPEGQLRIVVGFSPGGTGDLVSRLLADMVRAASGRTAIVDTRTGANGMIAAAAVARGTQDGSVVLQCPMGVMSVAPAFPGAQQIVEVTQDLIPVANIALSTFGMVVSSQSPYRTLEDFLAAARARPGALSYASSGIGSTQNLAGEMLKRLAGIDLVHVSYRGGAPSMVDIIAGRTDTTITNLAEVVRHIESGGLRLLALGDDSDSALFPNTPRMESAVPGYRMASWFGLCGPRGMPRVAISAWSEAIRQGLLTPNALRILGENGLSAHFEGPEAFADRIQRERTTFRDIIQAANIRGE